ERHGRGELTAERRGGIDADRPVEAGETLTLQPVKLADAESAERLLLAPGARHVGDELELVRRALQLEEGAIVLSKRAPVEDRVVLERELAVGGRLVLGLV